jgi:hypothetical protein
LSDIYCPPYSDSYPDNSPACLSTFSQQKPQEQIKTLLNVESEIEYSKNFKKKLALKKSPAKKSKSIKNHIMYEIAAEAAAEECASLCVDIKDVKIGIMTESDRKNMIRVNGKEELPFEEEKVEKNDENFNKKSPERMLHECASNNNSIEAVNSENKKKITKDFDESDGNNNCGDNLKFSTLPMINKQKNKRAIAIPQRITSDGTKIYYLCDLPKKFKKGFFFHIF